MMVLWNTLDYSLVDLLPFLFVRAAKVNEILRMAPPFFASLG